MYNKTIYSPLKIGKTIFLCMVIILSSAMQSAAEDRNVTITISRKYSDANCVSGYLLVDGRVICHALEKPWQNNLPEISSIPAGTYKAGLRTDNGKWRIELEDVPGVPGVQPVRKNIQIHSGNTPADSKGCILVGSEIDTSLCRVIDSRNAMAKMAEAVYGNPPIPNASLKLKVRIEDDVTTRTIPR